VLVVEARPVQGSMPEADSTSLFLSMELHSLSLHGSGAPIKQLAPSNQSRAARQDEGSSSYQHGQSTDMVAAENEAEHEELGAPRSPPGQRCVDDEVGTPASLVPAPQVLKSHARAEVARLLEEVLDHQWQIGLDVLQILSLMSSRAAAERKAERLKSKGEKKRRASEAKMEKRRLEEMAKAEKASLSELERADAAAAKAALELQSAASKAATLMSKADQLARNADAHAGGVSGRSSAAASDMNLASAVTSKRLERAGKRSERRSSRSGREGSEAERNRRPATHRGAHPQPGTSGGVGSEEPMEEEEEEDGISEVASEGSDAQHRETEKQQEQQQGFTPGMRAWEALNHASAPQAGPKVARGKKGVASKALPEPEGGAASAGAAVGTADSAPRRPSRRMSWRRSPWSSTNGGGAGARGGSTSGAARATDEEDEASRVHSSATAALGKERRRQSTISARKGKGASADDDSTDDDAPMELGDGNQAQSWLVRRRSSAGVKSRAQADAWDPWE
jgi:hypothetical protein